MTWMLQTITGESTGEKINIEHDLLVGRHQAADLVLDAPEVSRKHAAFRLKQDQLWVEDLKSSNGTFVNNLQIDQEVQLYENDVVQFASLKFLVLAPAQQNTDLPEREVQAIENDPEDLVVTPAQKMNDAGMPTLDERVKQESINREGMPHSVPVPKPAPLPPEGAVHLEKQVTEKNETHPIEPLSQAKPSQKNIWIIVIGLFVFMVLIMLFFDVFN